MAQYSEKLQELVTQVGARLKSKREAQGLSVEEIAARTRINRQFIHAMEHGDLDTLPGLAFVKGFLRNYVQALGDDDEELHNALDRLHALDTSIGPGSETHATSSVLESEPDKLPVWRIAMGAGLVLLLGWAAWLMFSGPSQPNVTDTRQEVRSPAAEQEASATPVQPAQDPAAGESTGPATTNIGPNIPQSQARNSAGTPLNGRTKLELTIRGLEPTWLRLSVDRAPPIDVRLETAETLAWEAQQEVRLTIGKSHGVSVYLNGEEIILPQERDRLIPNLVLNRLTLLRLEN